MLNPAGVFESGRGGALNLTLIPAQRDGHYNGSLEIKNMRVKDAPALAELLSAVSVVGLLEQLDGKGLAFNTVSADFILTPDQVVITKSKAVGASLGLTMDGTYDLESEVMNMQGVVSPLYFVNGVGQLVSREGEGLIGMNYKMRGTN